VKPESELLVGRFAADFLPEFQVNSCSEMLANEMAILVLLGSHRGRRRSILVVVKTAAEIGHLTPQHSLLANEPACRSWLPI